MSEEIPQYLLGVPVDRAVESGLHYVVLSRSESGTIGFRVRNGDRHKKRLFKRINKTLLLRAISRCGKEDGYEAAWSALRFRDWLLKYSRYCAENDIRPESTPAEETVKVSWYAKVGVQVKIYTDRVFPWQWFRK